MTGTACLINDYADTASRKSRNIDLFSAWLFGRVNTACLLVDISVVGGAVLVPVKQAVPAETFDLVVMSPDKPEEAHTIIRAEKRWINDSFSRTHKKVGMRFQYAGHGKLQEIKDLSELLAAQSKDNLVCYLLNHGS
jgi:hypothetical protein